MDRTLMELVFVLDRSGSMHGLEADTIGGYNSMICGQRRGGRALVTTVLFNGDSRIVHDRVPIHRVCEMSRDSYTVFGCTAMLDAVGSTIERISCEQRLCSRGPAWRPGRWHAGWGWIRVNPQETDVMQRGAGRSTVPSRRRSRH